MCRNVMSSSSGIAHRHTQATLSGAEPGPDWPTLDSASLNNPGPSGYGTILEHSTHTHKHTERLLCVDSSSKCTASSLTDTLQTVRESRENNFICCNFLTINRGKFIDFAKHLHLQYDVNTWGELYRLHGIAVFLSVNFLIPS